MSTNTQFEKYYEEHYWEFNSVECIDELELAEYYEEYKKNKNLRIEGGPGQGAMIVIDKETEKRVFCAHVKEW